jgi:hypothetical protein
MGGSVAARNAKGKYVRDVATATRDAEAARLRTRGVAYDAIASQLGYASKGAAYDGVHRALMAVVAEAGEDVRRIELERLDRMWESALAIAERFHVVVSNGRVVYDGERPVEDDMPALQAIDRLLRIQERRARLLGLDAPTKTEVRHVDVVDAEIERLVAQLAGTGQGSATPAAAPEGDA